MNDFEKRYKRHKRLVNFIIGFNVVLYIAAFSFIVWLTVTFLKYFGIIGG